MSWTYGAQVDWDEVLEATRSHESEFLGLDVEEATELASRLGLQLRLITPDVQALHLDLRPTRMTLDVRTGRVTEARAG